MQFRAELLSLSDRPVSVRTFQLFQNAADLPLQNRQQHDDPHNTHTRMGVGTLLQPRSFPIRQLSQGVALDAITCNF